MEVELMNPFFFCCCLFAVHRFVIHYSHGFITIIADKVQDYLRHKLDYCFGGIYYGVKMAENAMGRRHY